jgi:excisionase family DNA binding protein
MPELRTRPGQRRERSGRSLVDIPGVAAYLDISPRFVRRLIAERRIPFVRVGRWIRFDLDRIDEWLADNRVEAV